MTFAVSRPCQSLTTLSITWQPCITLRQLLTHTAGFNLDGTTGYPAGSPLPTLVKSLNGAPHASAPCCRRVGTAARRSVALQTICLDEHFFYLRQINASLRFKVADGRCTGLIFRQNGEPMEAARE